MGKHLFHLFFLFLLLLLMSFGVGAADAACEGYTFGTFNGSPACVMDSKLHICQNNFPDKDFREHVSEFLKVPVNGTTTKYHIDSINIINCRQNSCFNIRGIEYFINLTSLDCSVNYIKSLDLSKNTSLSSLHCASNTNLSSLNISSYKLLTELNCAYTNLGTLDLSHYSNLRILNCQKINLTELDLSKNTALVQLDCSLNQLTSLDLSNHPNLQKLVLGPQKLPLHKSNSKVFTLHISQLIPEESLQHIRPAEGSGVYTYDDKTGLFTVPAPQHFSELHCLYLVPTVSGTHPMLITTSLFCNHKYEYKSLFENGNCINCGRATGTFFDTIDTMLLASLAVCLVFIVIISIYIHKKRRTKIY